LNVLSLFDGMSCGRIALERAGIKVDTYYASEIDKYAVQIAQKNYPDTIQIGDVEGIDFEQFTGQIDLVIGGSPCQDLSIAKKDREGLKGSKSKLFWKYVDAINIIKPKYFLYENVASMKEHDKNVISEVLGFKPILINSALVSAQQRKRLYWTNIPGIEQPIDKGILLKDIVLEDAEPIVIHNIYGGFREKNVRVFEGKSPTLRTAASGGHIPYFVKKDFVLSEREIDYMNRATRDGRTHWDYGYIHDVREDKSKCLLANLFRGVPYNVFKDWDCIRKFHPIECERLQTLSDGYTDGVSNTQRYKMIGNGWTVDAIAHIFSYIH
jgi:DNA-cytosine methyltransferase